MNCKKIKFGNGQVGIVCGSFKKPKKCHYCNKDSTVLCDFPIKLKPRKKDCDIPMCDDCTQKGVSKNVDFCKTHYPIALEAYQRRMQRQ